MEENIAEAYLSVITILYTKLHKIFMYFPSVEIDQ